MSFPPQGVYIVYKDHIKKKQKANISMAKYRYKPSFGKKAKWPNFAPRRQYPRNFRNNLWGKNGLQKIKSLRESLMKKRNSLAPKN